MVLLCAIPVSYVTSNDDRKRRSFDVLHGRYSTLTASPLSTQAVVSINCHSNFS